MGTPCAFAIYGAKAIDTIDNTNDTTALTLSPVFFTTELPPPSISNISVDNMGDIINCNDNVFITFSSSIYTTTPACGPIVDLMKKIVYTDIVNDTTTITYDTLAVTYSLSADSTIQFLQPDSGFAPGYAYVMYVHPDRITGVPGGEIGEHSLCEAIST